jgi:ABC-2 type transport system permease protein
MQTALTIALREVRLAFALPLTYIVMAVLLFLFGYFFAANVLIEQQAHLRGFVFPASLFLTLITPLLTMRLLAEEQKLGTLELLLTSPVRDVELVFGKFLAAFTVVLAVLALTLYYPFLLIAFGDPDLGPMATGYLGLLLLGAANVAIGLLASSLTTNQIVAAVLGMAVLLFLWISESVANVVRGPIGEFFTYLSLRQHFDDFAWGVIEVGDIVYYLSLIAVALFLTVRVLELRRWR